MSYFWRNLAGLFLSCGCAWAQAGRSCQDSKLDPQQVAQALELAQDSKLALTKSGAKVALIARVGQDLSQYNLRYSHLAVVRYDKAHDQWLVVHELNECGTANSALYSEGLGNFFLDDMFAYDALIVIPGARVQAGLLELLDSTAARQLHSAHYNIVSYPFSTEYQNSNQWVLELLAAAEAAGSVANSREFAQAWLKAADYQPTTLHLSTLTRLGGRMFRSNVAFDDHPFNRRMAGLIDTVTVDSVVDFEKHRDSQLVTLTLHGRALSN